MIKNIFVFDVDGTLLDDNNLILDSTEETLNNINQEGNLIVLASARPLLSLKNLAKTMSVPIAGIIALNGSLAVHKSHNILEEFIPKTTYKKVLEVSKKYKIHINVYTRENWYIEVQNLYVEKEAEATGLKPDLIDSFYKLKEKVFKILLLGDPESIKKMQKILNNQMDSIEATISNPTYCEIVKKGSSKGKALKKLVQELKDENQLGNIIVFGDGENDIEMMKISDFSIAMENSSDKVKAASDYVTLSNNTNAISYAVENNNLL